MKFTRHAQIEQGIKQIHIAPFIGVIFLLSFFFMVSPLLVSQKGINVKLPRAVTSDTINEAELTITITGENLLYWNNSLVTAGELEQKLKKIARKKRAILIKADRRAYVGKIVDIWDLCRRLGIEKLNIATSENKT